MPCQFGSADCFGPGSGGHQCERCSAGGGGGGAGVTLSSSLSLQGASNFRKVVSNASPLQNRAMKIKERTRLTAQAPHVGSITRNTVINFTDPETRSRDHVETSDAETQVTRLWGDSIRHCCYICGFPIAGKDGIFPYTKTKKTRDPLMGKGAGEHILPAAAGFGYVGLFQTDYARGISGEWNPRIDKEKFEKSFLKHEMRWAHQYCNKIKGNLLFTHFTLHLGLFPNIQSIRDFIDDLWRGQVDHAGRRVFYGGSYGIEGGWVHLIHYWLDRCSSTTVDTEDKWRIYVKDWKEERVKHILKIVQDLCDEVNNHAKQFGPPSNNNDNFDWQSFLLQTYQYRIFQINQNTKDLKYQYNPDAREWQQLPVTIQPISNLPFSCGSSKEIDSAQKDNLEHTAVESGAGGGAGGAENKMEVEPRNMRGDFKIVNINGINYYLIPYDKLRPEIQQAFNQNFLGGPFNPIHSNSARVMSTQAQFTGDLIQLQDRFLLNRYLKDGILKIGHLLIPQDVPQALHHYANSRRTRKTRKRNQQKRKTRKNQN